MRSFQKYLLVFLGYAVSFIGILCLFDWTSLTLSGFYHNLFQGLLFGIFMAFYEFWCDKRRKGKKHQTE